MKVSPARAFNGNCSAPVVIALGERVPAGQRHNHPFLQQQG